MIIFQDYFEKSNGQPIEYKGKTIVMWDQFAIPQKITQLRYRFVSTDSEWRQGIKLKTNGKFVINEQTIPNCIVLWEDTAPAEGELECDSNNGIIEVVNVWDTGDGVVESWYSGAAMVIEVVPKGRKYHCNDGHPDDDFNDLVFELMLV